jgi:hypothetical protein
MKYLLLFEKYLESNYPPLYHYTKYSLEKILDCDTLIIKTPYIGKSCICLTRSSSYTYDDNWFPRLKLNQNKLRLDGYVPKSIDEFSKDDNPHKRKFGKSLWNNTEWEFEERIFKDIHKLGKYIISIQIPNSSDYEVNIRDYNGRKYRSRDFIYLDYIKKYLEKYSHIKLEYYDVKKRLKITNVPKILSYSEYEN